MHFTSQCANSEKVTPLWGQLYTGITESFTDYCALVVQLRKEKLSIEESYYATEVCLVLYRCFVKEMALKCGG